MEALALTLCRCRQTACSTDLLTPPSIAVVATVAALPMRAILAQVIASLRSVGIRDPVLTFDHVSIAARARVAQCSPAHSLAVARIDVALSCEHASMDPRLGYWQSVSVTAFIAQAMHSALALRPLPASVAAAARGAEARGVQRAIVASLSRGGLPMCCSPSVAPMTPGGRRRRCFERASPPPRAAACGLHLLQRLGHCGPICWRPLAMPSLRRCGRTVHRTSDVGVRCCSCGASAPLAACRPGMAVLRRRCACIPLRDRAPSPKRDALTRRS